MNMIVYKNSVELGLILLAVFVVATLLFFILRKKLEESFNFRLKGLFAFMAIGSLFFAITTFTNTVSIDSEGIYIHRYTFFRVYDIRFDAIDNAVIIPVKSEKSNIDFIFVINKEVYWTPLSTQKIKKF